MIGTHCPTCSQEHTANALKIHDLEQQLAASKKDHDALEFLRKHPEYQLMRSVVGPTCYGVIDDFFPVSAPLSHGFSDPADALLEAAKQLAEIAEIAAHTTIKQDSDHHGPSGKISDNDFQITY